MALMTLPVEILVDILSLTRPYAFENLALTCKPLHDAARPFLNHHNRLRGAYRHFSYDWQDGDPQDIKTKSHPASALQLLCQISEDPIIAEYIVEADLTGQDYGNNDKNVDSESSPTPDPFEELRTTGALKQLVYNAPYLRATYQDTHQWLSLIVYDFHPDDTCYTDWSTTFLLTLLPNVEVLRLPKVCSILFLPNRSSMKWKLLLK